MTINDPIMRDKAVATDANNRVILQQYWDAEKDKYMPLSNGDLTGIDISQYAMLLDANFRVIPQQYFDVNEMKFVLGLPEGAGGMGAKGDKGDQGEPGPPGPKGDKGDQGNVGPEGVQGPQGPEGRGIELGFTYMSYAAMVADIDNIPDNALILINSGPGNPNNGELYAKTHGELILNGKLEGVVGPPGPQGSQGPRGEQGAEGPMGPQGPQGEKGDIGQQGEQGPKGDVGPVGPKGDKGDKGDAGPQGAIGPKGDKGDKGDVGPRGDIGPEGPRGPQGERGEQGVEGPAGPRGETGPRGPEGIQGPMGPRGNGFDIAMRYPSVDAMNADFDNREVGEFVLIDAEPGDPDNGTLFERMPTEFERISQLAGARGDDGPPGPQGPAGETGPQGPQGPRGVQGPVGPRGQQGLGVRFRGIVENEGQLAAKVPTAQPGDFYMIGGTQYFFTDDPNLSVEPTFLRGNDITGPQGPKGDKGDKGDSPADIGTANLLTNAQTIKEAINEVFQTGNNVKRDTVNALLSKDPTLPINVNSTWSAIQVAINQIMTGYKVNGTDVNNAMALTNFEEGDFVNFYTRFLGTSITANNIFPVATSNRMAYAQVSDGLIMVVAPRGAGATDTNTQQSVAINLIQKTGNTVASVAAIIASSTANSGLNPDIIKLDDTTYVVAITAGTTSPSYRLQFIRVTLGANNTLTASTPYTIDTGVYTGDEVSMVRLSSTKILVAHENGSAGARIRVVTYNPSNSTNMFTSGTPIEYAKVGRNIKLLPIDESAGRYVLLAGAAGSGTNSTPNSYISREVNVNLTTDEVSFPISSGYYVRNIDGGANSARAIAVRMPSGRNDIFVFTRDVNNNNGIGVSRLVYSAEIAHPTTSFISLNTGAGSGGSTANSRVSIHDAHYVGNGLIALVYTNNNANNLLSGVIDINNLAAGVVGAGPIQTVAGSKRLPRILDFGPTTGYGLARISTVSGAGQWQFAAFSPVGGYAKHLGQDINATGIGIARSQGRAGTTFQVRRATL